MSERRSNEKNDMKRSIQDAAIEIIREEGYEKLSLRKIAAKIDYSATNIYNYYQNKAEIIKHIIIRKSISVTETVEKTLQEKQDLPIEEQFYWFVRIFIETMIDDPEQVRAIFQTGINVYADYEMKDEHTKGIPKIWKFLEKGHQQNIFKVIDETTTTLIIVSLLGVVSLIINNQILNKKQINLLIDLESNLLLNGILKKENL